MQLALSDFSKARRHNLKKSAILNSSIWRHNWVHAPPLFSSEQALHGFSALLEWFLIKLEHSF